MVDASPGEGVPPKRHYPYFRLDWVHFVSPFFFVSASLSGDEGPVSGEAGFVKNDRKFHFRPDGSTEVWKNAGPERLFGASVQLNPGCRITSVVEIFPAGR